MEDFEWGHTPNMESKSEQFTASIIVGLHLYRQHALVSHSYPFSWHS